MKILFSTGNEGKLKEFAKLLGNEKSVFSLNDVKHNADKKYIEPSEDSNFFIINGLIKLLATTKFIYINREIKNDFVKIVVDDSGLCVPALNYLPGVHSAAYAGMPKSNKNNNTLLAKNVSESSEAKDYNNQKRLNAFFVCFLMSLDIVNIEEFNFLEKFNLESASNLINNTNKYFIEDFEKNIFTNINLNLIGNSSHINTPLNLFHNSFPEFIHLNIYFGYCSGEVGNIEQCLIPDAGHGYDPLFYPKNNLNLSFSSISLEEKNKISHRSFAFNEFQKN
jgi:inosine/xanthosine triphosphate pyrophosphatase family protein